MAPIRFFSMLLAVLVFFPSAAESNPLKSALAKARAFMQSAFQMTFLAKLPVVFHKHHFGLMMAHTAEAVDKMAHKSGENLITPNQIEADKKLHIKKSAELALHIQSLIGSAHLAYGMTMAIGLVKEAIDGSFLNPHGHRDRRDLAADHVGAMAVFGQKRFDRAFEKKIGSFFAPSTTIGAPQPPIRDNQSLREQLLKDYQAAVKGGDNNAAQGILARIRVLTR